MVTAFALLCDACGLSHREAADLLEASLDTVRSWAAGRRAAPQRQLDQLAGLAARIEQAVADLLDPHRAATPLRLHLAADHAEAQRLGWPCVGSHRAVVARVVAVAIRHGHQIDFV